MVSEKFEKNFLILKLPYNIGICTKIAHTNSLHPPTFSQQTLDVWKITSFLTSSPQFQHFFLASESRWFLIMCSSRQPPSTNNLIPFSHFNLTGTCCSAGWKWSSSLIRLIPFFKCGRNLEIFHYLRNDKMIWIVLAGFVSFQNWARVCMQGVVITRSVSNYNLNRYSADAW